MSCSTEATATLDRVICWSAGMLWKLRDCGSYETGRDFAPGRGADDNTGAIVSTKR